MRILRRKKLLLFSLSSRLEVEDDFAAFHFTQTGTVAQIEATVELGLLVPYHEVSQFIRIVNHLALGCPASLVLQVHYLTTSWSLK